MRSDCVIIIEHKSKMFKLSEIVDWKDKCLMWFDSQMWEILNFVWINKIY